MPRAEDDAVAVAKRADGSFDADVYFAEYKKGLEQRHERLMTDARAVFRALDGWAAVRTAEDWQESVRRAAEDLDSGGFLIERLGAERYVDPPLMAVLLTLRRRLIDEHGATTAAELMLIDSAVLSYYHLLRVNGWIGDLSIWLEREFFGRDKTLSAKLKDYYGTDRVRGLTVEEIVQRLVEQLMPLLDRSNRMLLRNLKALRVMREGSLPSVSIGTAGQVNVAAAQANAVQGVADGGRAAGDAATLLPAPAPTERWRQRRDGARLTGERTLPPPVPARDADPSR